MAAKLERTNTPGSYRRHKGGCRRDGRCECSYVVVLRHRGRQHTETYRTLVEAREAKGNRDAGEGRPVARLDFEEYFTGWIDSYAGRTAHGFAESSRSLYRRAVEDHALPRWRTWKLGDVEPADVRALYTDLRNRGLSGSAIKAVRAPLSAMFATAVEDGLLRSNPVSNVRIPADTDTQEDEKAKALTREERRCCWPRSPRTGGCSSSSLPTPGCESRRRSRCAGSTWTSALGQRVLVREQVYEGKRKRLKSRHGRRDIPLSAGMAARLLARRRDAYRGERNPVFGTGTGTELSRSNVAGRVLKPAADNVGLGWVSFHTFRHSCASLLFEGGKNVKQVQEWLGHADPGFTLRTYVHPGLAAHNDPWRSPRCERDQLGWDLLGLGGVAIAVYALTVGPVMGTLARRRQRRHSPRYPLG
jgi:site-specific recombinase XerD